MPDRARNLVGGRWVEAVGGATLEDVNPANRGDVLTLAPRSDYRDVERAVEAARAGFADLGRQDLTARAAILDRAADGCRAQAEELAGLLSRESGALLAGARAEVAAAIRILRAVVHGMSVPRGRASWEARRRRLVAAAPVGVIGVITSWTFPLAAPAALVGAALGSGNAVVWKSPEQTPLLATALVQLFLDSGLPAAALGLLHGTGEESGAPLVRHPEVKLVAFSGSSDVGREIGIACAAERKVALLETQGREALLLLDDGDLDAALAEIHATLGVAALRRPLLHLVVQGRGAGREFQTRLVEVVAALQPGVEVPPLISDRHLKRLQAYVRLGLKEGAKLGCGGEVFREGECRKGYFYTPTVLTDLQPRMRVAQEEASGPLVAVLPAETLEEAVETVNRIATGSGVSLYGRDLARAIAAAGALRANVIRLNPGSREGLEPGECLPATGETAEALLDRMSRWRRVSIEACPAAGLGHGELDTGPA